MTIQYITNINDTDKAKTLLLIDASIQAYNAFNDDSPETCQKNDLTPRLPSFSSEQSWKKLLQTRVISARITPS